MCLNPIQAPDTCFDLGLAGAAPDERGGMLAGTIETPQNNAVIERAVKAITGMNQGKSQDEYGRNDRVVITNGTEEREMKYKKAEPMIMSGAWKIKP